LACNYYTLYANYKNLYNKIKVLQVYGLIIAHVEFISEKSIAIITVLLNRNNYEEYRLAQESFECYALYHNYEWIVINFSANKTLQKLCPQKDFFFARHCVTAKIMEEHNETEWFLFIDADMAVINPSHLIEEWIDTNVNLIFYNRIFNQEIMAGSYIIRNTPYSREFLRFWANYEDKLPFHIFGSDNGALHVNFISFFTFSFVERRFCERIWQNASFDGLSIYVSCIRRIIGEAPIWPGQVRILPKGKAWARDTWLTDSMWSKRDFVLHGWQRRKINGVMFGGWPSPISLHNFNLSLCKDFKTAFTNWHYKDSFIRNDIEIDNWLNKKIMDSKYAFKKELHLVDSYWQHSRLIGELS
ncbi:unnamed protein product, partial [Thelazia callipaeda]|uniref:Nucleotid_trans domain-containing protein n=1 Tax=Thelazia callipaeda TaxID=103827 RepID=A0A0N5CWD9_THECL